jgi:hypothetical protein
VPDHSDVLRMFRPDDRSLNLAVANRAVTQVAAAEWGGVEPFKAASRRRELFLDVMERRALLANATGAVRQLIEATMQTGCRAGEWSCPDSVDRLSS